MKIAIGADHRGFAHKQYLKQTMKDIEWVDVGAFNDERSDHPIFAKKVAEKIQQNEVDYGVLICGSGTGIAIAANKQSGILAGIVWNESIARSSKEHNNVNVLVIPADFVSPQDAAAFIDIWLHTEFLGGRYQQRLDMIEK